MYEGKTLNPREARREQLLFVQRVGQPPELLVEGRVEMWGQGVQRKRAPPRTKPRKQGGRWERLNYGIPLYGLGDKMYTTDPASHKRRTYIFRVHYIGNMPSHVVLKRWTLIGDSRKPPEVSFVSEVSFLRTGLLSWWRSGDRRVVGGRRLLVRLPAGGDVWSAVVKVNFISR